MQEITRHGINSSYICGCRCEECRKAHREESRNWQRRRGKPVGKYCERVEVLASCLGVSVRTIWRLAIWQLAALTDGEIRDALDAMKEAERPKSTRKPKITKPPKPRAIKPPKMSAKQAEEARVDRMMQLVDRLYQRRVA